MMSRFRTLLLAAVFFSVGVGIFVLVLVTDLMPLMNAIRTEAPNIDINPRNFAGLPLGVGLLAISVMLAIPYQKDISPRHRDQRKQHPPHKRNWAAVCLAILAINIVLALAATPITIVVVDSILDGRNYVSCGSRSWERHPLFQWARKLSDESQEPCTASAADLK